MKHLLALAITLTLAGCSNVWQESYQPFVGTPELDSKSRVTVREIPWRRMESALREQEEMLAQSDVHWEEWSDEQRREANGKLLRALQISDDLDRVTLVGVSSFRTTDRVTPWDGSLAEFARKKGAHYAVWSDRYLGKAETIVTRTVWSDTTDHITYEDATGEDRQATRRRSTSTDVPLVVEKDETGYTAFFLRVE